MTFKNNNYKIIIERRNKQMLKLTIEIKENKGKESSNVKIIVPKDLSKATENERLVGAMVKDQCEKALSEIQVK